MPKHVIEGISEHDRIVAKTYATELLHNAPQTEKFFNPSVDLSDIKSREEQKQEARDQGKSLRASETSKYFERATVSTIQNNIRPTIVQYMEFAKSRGATNLQSALSPKTVLKFFQFQEERVESREITPDSYKTYIGRIKVMANLANATEGLPNLNIDKMVNRAIEKVDEYVKKMKDTDNPVVNEKHSVKAYVGDEMTRIIEGIKDEKIKTVVSVIAEHGFRIRNISNIYLDTVWQGDKRVKVDESLNKIAVRGKGNQKHTITLSEELKNKLKQFVDKNNEIHVRQKKIREEVEESCDRQGIKYISVHNLRATYAYNLYKDLKANGYSEQEARQFVSNNMFHGRTSITMHYVNSAYR